MKKRICLLTALVLFYGCKGKKDTSSIVKSDVAIKSTINLIIDDWHKAASEANYANYFNAMDSVSVFIGTDASENWKKSAFSEFSKPYFDKGKAWDFTPIERNVYVNKTQEFVWFDELLNTWMGICRGSGVLEKKENQWKIKQYVLSVAIPNDDVDAVIVAKKKSDSIFLERFNKI